MSRLVGLNLLALFRAGRGTFIIYKGELKMTITTAIKNIEITIPELKISSLKAVCEFLRSKREETGYSEFSRLTGIPYANARRTLDPAETRWSVERLAEAAKIFI